MANVNVISDRLLKLGESVEGVKVSIVGVQALSLKATSVKQGTVDSQLRVTVLSEDGHVLHTVLLQNSDSETFRVLNLDGQFVEIIVEDLLGSARVSVVRVTDQEADPFGASAGVVDGSVTTPKLAAGAVTKAKMALFTSAEQTGTGAPQNVAHGLGVIPSGVLIGVTDDAGGGGFVIAEGAHTSTNVVVTAPVGVKFKVWAIA